MIPKKAKLIRHSFADRPDWVLVREEIPIGTEYTLIFPLKEGTIFNMKTGEKRDVLCCQANRNGIVGMMPIDVFQVLE